MKRRTGDVLGYARVSTPDQDVSGQVERLRRESAVRVFEDVVSGRTFDRPGLAALLDYARPGDTLAVIRLDRLGRSLRELLETVDTLKAQEIDLISLEEDINTTSAAGELVFHVFAAIAVKSSSKLTQDSRSKLTHLFPAACCRRTSAGGCVMAGRGRRELGYRFLRHLTDRFARQRASLSRD